ncbi:MAG: Calx-beta domain-containing protein [Cyanobacteria bacterium P01_A01_bin.84]
MSDNRFEVVNSQLKLKDDVSLDFESETSINLQITAIDESGQSVNKSFAIAITDVNETTPPTVSIAVIDNTASENRDIATFRITRTGDTSNLLTVNYTVAGNATNGTDYNNLTGTVTINAAETETDIIINSNDDNLVEDTENITLTLINNAAYQLSVSNAATANIVDNDTSTNTDINVNNNNIFTLNNNTQRDINLLAQLTGRTSSVVNEVGFFIVEDDQGSITDSNGNLLTPSDGEAYIKAALSSNQTEVIFSAIFNSPNGFNQNQRSRILEDIKTNRHLQNSNILW